MKKRQVGLVIAAIGTWNLACASARTDFENEYKGAFLVSGKGLIPMGISEGDTLPEVQEPPVPVIAAKAASVAGKFGYDPNCTRYFSSEERVVAVLKLRCNEDIPIDDGEGLVAFTADGDVVGLPTSVVRDEYTSLEPARRVRSAEN